MCGDWELYKDEHCYKLFDGLQSYNDSIKKCEANNAHIVSIHYAEEQVFLQNYIFTKKKSVDNVWIGAKYLGNNVHQWEDRTVLHGYSNWATGNPKDLSDHCVEMTADEGLVGKWVDERCAKKNLVVCQRMPLPSISKLAETIIALKHSLEETKQELAQLKNDSIPVGFIYVQLPYNKPPTELWPRLTWTDVSSDFSGVFFRVAGGNATSFGDVQEEQAPHLDQVHTGNSDNIIGSYIDQHDNYLNIPKSGWSNSVYSGSSSGYDYYMAFKYADYKEVRPRNMAVKVYKRTA